MGPWTGTGSHFTRTASLFASQHALQSATSKNMLFAEDGVYAMQATFDPNMAGAVPYTVLMAANDDVLYEQAGDLDTEKVGRAILANLPDTEESPAINPIGVPPAPAP
jgi:hypothetical protein